MSAKLTVTFAEHVPVTRVRGMIGTLQSAGEMRAEGPRRFTVIVRRPARLDYLRKQLTAWDEYGFLTWSEAP